MSTEMNERELRTCRVCGYMFADFQPWGGDGKTPSFSYCPCCFTEFGFDDTNVEVIKERRKRWIDQGCLWYEPAKEPENWSAVEQLKNIPEVFR